MSGFINPDGSVRLGVGRSSAFDSRVRSGLRLSSERESAVAEGQVATKKMSEAITRTLPFLRRYARAVTGSQQQGDEWVRLCAEVAVQQPELIAEAEDTKVGVFALFHRLRQPFGDIEVAASGGEAGR